MRGLSPNWLLGTETLHLYIRRRYYARVTHCITALQVCVLIILFCLDLQDYFYAGYVSIVLVAVFMVMGKIAVKRYVK